MQTINAIYDNGQVYFLDKPNFKKAKIKIEFIEEIQTQENSIMFPTQKLGKVQSINREDIYDEFLSDRY